MFKPLFIVILRTGQIQDFFWQGSLLETDIDLADPLIKYLRGSGPRSPRNSPYGYDYGRRGRHVRRRTSTDCERRRICFRE